MELRKRKVVQPYDLWKEDDATKVNKLHPSAKRNKKNPLPHPGQSYNPDPEDHKRLLQKVLKKELAHQKKEAHLRKAIKVKVDKDELSKDARDELIAGIEHLIDKNGVVTQKGHESEESTDDEAFIDYDDKDFEAIAKDKTVEERRKSKQQRLRQLKDRLQRKAAKLRKIKNIRLSKFDQIKKMIKELDAKEKEEAKKKASKKHRSIKGERLGQKFEQSDPIYCLSSELPSNLRQVSCPMDALVREQLESFQSRLMVEPTRFQVKKRKYKKRRFDRQSAEEADG